MTCCNSVVLNRELMGAVMAPIFAAPMMIATVSMHSCKKYPTLSPGPTPRANRAFAIC